jgi:hypothetical protein
MTNTTSHHRLVSRTKREKNHCKPNLEMKKVAKIRGKNHLLYKFSFVLNSFSMKTHLAISFTYVPDPEANPTIVSYNASAVKNYNSTSSLVRFKTKKSI